MEKIEYKHFTKNINRFITATKNWTKDNSCAKTKYYEHFSPDKLKPKEKEKNKLNLNKSTLKDCLNILYNNINKQYQKN